MVDDLPVPVSQTVQYMQGRCRLPVESRQEGSSKTREGALERKQETKDVSHGYALFDADSDNDA